VKAAGDRKKDILGKSYLGTVEKGGVGKIEALSP
jgi:hypothetical protein